jgi:hypothetical protein
MPARQGYDVSPDAIRIDLYVTLNTGVSFAVASKRQEQRELPWKRMAGVTVRSVNDPSKKFAYNPFGSWIRTFGGV